MQTETPPVQVVTHRENSPYLVATTTVLALIVIYFIVFEPVFRSARSAARQSEEEKYVRAADLALIQYLGDHGERYPDLSGDMVATLRPYIKDPKVIEAMGRFFWNEKLCGKKEADLDDPSSEWVLFSSVRGSSMFAVGFADGHSHYAAGGYLARILTGKAQQP